MRVNKFADIDKDINMHLIISDQNSTDYIDKQIINSLKFIDGKVVQPKDIIENLSKGRHPIETDSFKSMLEANRENLIVAISYNEAAYIKQKDTLSEALKDLKVDCIFCATEHSNFYNRSKTIKKNDALKNLAIINGSDKHNPKGKDGHCNDFSKFSWIKANPTFNGLRLAISSPNDRIYISNRSPVDKANIYKFKCVKSEVFVNNKLELNEHGLISIIGNKAQGKSLLGSIIASIDKNNQSLEKYDFMKDVKIEFNDNEPNNIKCKWLSQHYIEEIVNNLGKKELDDKLQNELERIVFSHANHAKEEIRKLNENIKKTQEDINKLNSSFASYNKCENEIKKLQEQEHNYQNEKKLSELLKTDSENITSSSEYKEYNNIVENISRVKDKLEKITKLNNTLEDIKKKYDEYIEFVVDKDKKINEKLEEYKEILSELNFNDINDFCFDKKLEKQQAIINKLRDKLKKENEHLQTEIENNKNLLNDKKSNLEETKNYKLEDIEEISKIEERINRAQKNIADTKKEKEKKEKKLEEIETDKKKHKQQFIKLFKLFYDRKTKYIELKKSIDESIKDLITNAPEHNELYTNYVEHELKKVTFEVKYDSEFITKYTNNVLHCLNNNKINAHDIEQEIKTCSDKLLNSACIENDAESLYNIIIKHFLCENINQKLRRYYSYDTNNDYSDTYLNKVFNIDLKANYEILYKKKEIKKLSAGERGTALLLLYLLLDKEYEQYPLIVDQPEDNIDNQTINEALVPAIKLAKSKRQVFLITHNPNLVVNTDSEQVIIAKSDSEDKYSYMCGSLENPEIVDCICQILEGGKEAFQKRYQSYYPKDSKILNNTKF